MKKTLQKFVVSNINLIYTKEHDKLDLHRLLTGFYEVKINIYNLIFVSKVTSAVYLINANWFCHNICIGISGHLIVGSLGNKELAEEYTNSANISYSPFIANPDSTRHQTSRMLANRYSFKIELIQVYMLQLLVL